MKKIILCFLVCFTTNVLSQNYKFGKVSKEELEEKFYSLDSTAKAAYLYKQHKNYYRYNGDTGWTLVTEVHERIKIYDKAGLDYVTKSINLYTDNGNDEDLTVFKASTYKLVNNKIKKEKLSRKSTFKEKKSKNWTAFKFTMPNVNIGDVVEWKYKINSPYYTYIDDIELQNFIPIKKLDVDVSFPEYFVFKKNIKGLLYTKVDEKVVNKTISFSSRGQVNSSRITTQRSSNKVNLTEKVYSIRKSKVPSLQKEIYVNNINNYKSVLQFELSYTHFPGSRIRPYATNWDKVSKKIFETSGFGYELGKTSFFKSELQEKLNGATTNAEKLNAIYQFAKEKIKWNGNYGKYVEKGVRKAYKEGIGNVADINLNLVSMLRVAGFNASPVLVSTKSNGVFYFPTIKGFNYVVAAVELTGGVVLLDATEVYCKINQLPKRAVNWKGRLVKKDGSSLSINLTDNQNAIKEHTVNIKIDDQDNVVGLIRSKYKDQDALSFRKKFNHIKEEDVIAHFEEKFEIEIEGFKISNKNNIYKPLSNAFKFTSDNLIEDINGEKYIYPLLFLTKKENPFKANNRKIPVEFGTSWKENYRISIQIPQGYKIKHLPESLAVGISNNLGVFKYQISNTGSKINVISIIQLNTSVISPNYYEELKAFYKKMIEKQTEKIVLIKE